MSDSLVENLKFESKHEESNANLPAAEARRLTNAIIAHLQQQFTYKFRFMAWSGKRWEWFMAPANSVKEITHADWIAAEKAVRGFVKFCKDKWQRDQLANSNEGWQCKQPLFIFTPFTFVHVVDMHAGLHVQARVMWNGCGGKCAGCSNVYCSRVNSSISYSARDFTKLYGLRRPVQMRKGAGVTRISTRLPSTYLCAIS